MKREVLDRLVTGLSQYLGAQSAGSSRFAIADGYLAMDNYFSGLLLELGVKPSFNHQKKLEQVFENAPGVFQQIGLEASDFDPFYAVWQDVRYSPRNPPPQEAIQYLRLSRDVMRAIRKEVAGRHGLQDEQLEEMLYGEVMGGRWSSFDEECGEIHERWQMEAERAGEMGYGSKLGNKMMNPSNFSDVRAFADDEVTRDLIANDAEFGSHVAKFYDEFLRLIVDVQFRRAEAGITPEEVSNFMLSLRLRYHGQNAEEVAKDWGARMATALKRVADDMEKEPPSE